MIWRVTGKAPNLRRAGREARRLAPRRAPKGASRSHQNLRPRSSFSAPTEQIGSASAKFSAPISSRAAPQKTARTALHVCASERARMCDTRALGRCRALTSSVPLGENEDKHGVCATLALQLGVLHRATLASPGHPRRNVAGPPARCPPERTMVSKPLTPTRRKSRVERLVPRASGLQPRGRKQARRQPHFGMCRDESSDCCALSAPDEAAPKVLR
jgi:hypothetical protein